MNKKELVKKMSDKTGLPKTTCNACLKAFISTVQDYVTAGDDVVLTGFGKFTRRFRKERNGRDPSTGRPMTIPSRYYPAFKAGVKFKRAVQQ
jgi:DNA-binding protein HU-beta